MSDDYSGSAGHCMVDTQREHGTGLPISSYKWKVLVISRLFERGEDDTNNIEKGSKRAFTVVKSIELCVDSKNNNFDEYSSPVQILVVSKTLNQILLLQLDFFAFQDMLDPQGRCRCLRQCSPSLPTGPLSCSELVTVTYITPQAWNVHHVFGELDGTYKGSGSSLFLLLAAWSLLWESTVRL
jgi:hypothetical protein